MPSAYFLTDVFLQLDELLDYRVYVEDAENGRGSRVTQACADATRAKRCCGAIRYLWRNSKKGSHDESIQKIKEVLQESPTQCRKSKRSEDPEALCDADSDAESEAEAAEAEGEESEQGNDSDHSEPEEIPVSQATTLVMGEVSEEGEVPPSQPRGEDSEESEVEPGLVEKLAGDIQQEMNKDEAICGLLGLKLNKVYRGSVVKRV